MKKVLLSTILALSVFLLTNLNVSAQQSWGGGGGLWTSAGWSNTGIAPYDQAYVPGSAVIFNVAGTIGGTSGIIFSSIAATENMTVIASGNTISTGGTVAPINVGVGKTLDFSSQPMSTAAGTGLIKNGLGTLALAGATYSSGFTLNAGTVVARGINAFGNDVLTINGGAIAGFTTLASFATKHTNIIISDNFTFGVDVDGIALSTKDLTFGSPVSLGTENRVITLKGTGVNTLSGMISSIGGGLSTGTGSTGTLNLSGANTYTGPTTLSGGTLTLGASEVIPNASAVVFNGGTLKTGAFNETYSTVNLSDNSIITLNNSVQSHNFAASNAISWTSGKTLTITGWTGGYNSTSGTKGKIFVGNAVAGLTAGQLLQIKFVNASSVMYDATILATGEVVPSAITVLPISLASFTAKAVDKTILLSWNTASEQNNKSFEVQHSADGKVFTTIGNVDGAGTSTSLKSYSFSDENPNAGVNYYQLVQHDFDGKTSTSFIVALNSKISGSQLDVYAGGEQLRIFISSANQTNGELQVFEIGGKQLVSKNISLNRGYNTINLPFTVQPGVHFVRFTSDSENLVKKFIK